VFRDAGDDPREIRKWEWWIFSSTVILARPDDVVVAKLEENANVKAQLRMLKIELMTPEQDEEFHMDMGTATEGPTMPEIELSASVEPALGGIQYRFQVGDPGTDQALEYEDAPAGYEHPSMIDSGWIAESSWTIDFNDDIYGGHVTRVTVSVMIEGREISKTCEREFWILGDALTTPLRNAYIDSRTQYTTTIRTMAKKIAYRETFGTHYYNPDEGQGHDTAHSRYPIIETNGSGYGVMQLTDPDALDIDTIWNWKANIDKGMEIINSRYNSGVSYLAGLPIPGGATAEQKLLEGYNRWNGGAGDRYHWWSTGPANHNGVPEGLRRFGYIATNPDPRSTKGYRDYNEDNVQDGEGNPYNIPSGPTGPNEDANRAARYADSILYHGQGDP